MTLEVASICVQAGFTEHTNMRKKYQQLTSYNFICDHVNQCYLKELVSSESLDYLA